MSSEWVDYSFLKSLLPRTAVLWLGEVSVATFVMWALVTILPSMSGWYLGAGVFVSGGVIVASFRLNAQMARGVELLEGVVPTP